MTLTRCISCIAVFLATSHAAADTDGAARARAAFVEGTRLAKAGNWRDALQAFERSSELKPHAVTTYNIAYCERALGHYVRAWVLFARALASEADSLPPELARSAAAYREEAEQRLARVTVSVPPEATLTVDDAPLVRIAELLAAGLRDEEPAATLPDSFELVADPGPHTFRIARRGARFTSVRRVLVPGNNAPIAFEPEPEPQRSSAAPVAPAPVVDRGREPVLPPDYTWPILAYGAGGLGLVVGSVFGVRALDRKQELDQLCPDRTCPRRHQDRLDAANRDALISTIGFGVGLAGAAVGTYLLATVSPESPPQAVAPRLGPGWVGIGGGF